METKGSKLLSVSGVMAYYFGLAAIAAVLGGGWSLIFGSGNPATMLVGTGHWSLVHMFARLVFVFIIMSASISLAVYPIIMGRMCVRCHAKPEESKTLVIMGLISIPINLLTVLPMYIALTHYPLGVGNRVVETAYALLFIWAIVTSVMVIIGAAMNSNAPHSGISGVMVGVLPNGVVQVEENGAAVDS